MIQNIDRFAELYSYTDYFSMTDLTGLSLQTIKDDWLGVLNDGSLLDFRVVQMVLTMILRRYILALDLLTW